MSDDIATGVHDSSPSSLEKPQQPPNMEILDEWQVAKRGIVLWLNNEPQRAESYLKAHIDSSVHAMTSYTFVAVIVSYIFI